MSKSNLSNFDRMNTPGVYTVKPQVIRERFKLSVEQKLDESTRRIVKSVKYKKSDTAKALNQYHVNDFAIENLMAVGAQLNNTKLSASRFGELDRLEASIN